MRKFVQLTNGNTVYAILEYENKPEFASNIVLVEVPTDTEVHEGWLYNFDTKTFGGPVYTDQPSNADLREDQKALMLAICDIYSILDDIKSKLGGTP